MHGRERSGWPDEGLGADREMHGALQSASIFDGGPAESNRIWIWMED